MRERGRGYAVIKRLRYWIVVGSLAAVVADYDHDDQGETFVAGCTRIG